VSGKEGSGYAIGFSVARNIIGWDSSQQETTYKSLDDATSLKAGDTVKISSGPLMGDV
jgi:hypothetical protein